MAGVECCEAKSLTWRQTQVADRWADVCVCRSCEHIHAMESWPAPLRFDPEKSCANCGGNRPLPSTPCDRCGLTEERDRSFHERLLTSAPDGTSLLEAAAAAQLSGRLVLALKLSTASLAWEDQPIEAWRLRLQILEAMGRLDEALEEAARWVRDGGPPFLYGVIAGLQAAMGDLEAAAETLTYGVREDPSDIAMWADLSELLDLLGDVTGSLEAAGQAMVHPDYQERAIAIIRKVANLYYQRGQFDDAVVAGKHAGDHQRRFADLSWIRAQASIFAAKDDEALEWARAVLAVEPEHSDAVALVERFEPRQKKGWFTW